MIQQSGIDTLERRMFARPIYGRIVFSIAVIGRVGAIVFDFHAVSPSSYDETFVAHGVEFFRRIVPGVIANRETCSLLDGEPAYHDGTSMWAEEVVLPIFLQFGSEGVFNCLERRYADWKNDLDLDEAA